MASFGKKSQERLNTCDPRLIELFERVVEDFDCTVLQGHRGEEEQNKLQQPLHPEHGQNLLPLIILFLLAQVHY